PGGGEAVRRGHLDVEDGPVGTVLADQLDHLVAAARLPHHDIALLLEGLFQIETDDGLVLGDDNARGCRRAHRAAWSRSWSSWVSRRAISAATRSRCRRVFSTVLLASSAARLSSTCSDTSPRTARSS